MKIEYLKSNFFKMDQVPPNLSPNLFDQALIKEVIKQSKVSHFSFLIKSFNLTFSDQFEPFDKIVRLSILNHLDDPLDQSLNLIIDLDDALFSQLNIELLYTKTDVIQQIIDSSIHFKRSKFHHTVQIERLFNNFLKKECYSSILLLLENKNIFFKKETGEEYNDLITADYIFSQIRQTKAPSFDKVMNKLVHSLIIDAYPNILPFLNGTLLNTSPIIFKVDCLPVVIGSGNFELIQYLFKIDLKGCVLKLEHIWDNAINGLQLKARSRKDQIASLNEFKIVNFLIDKFNFDQETVLLDCIKTSAYYVFIALSHKFDQIQYDTHMYIDLTIFSNKNIVYNLKETEDFFLFLLDKKVKIRLETIYNIIMIGYFSSNLLCRLVQHYSQTVLNGEPFYLGHDALLICLTQEQPFLEQFKTLIQFDLVKDHHHPSVHVLLKKNFHHVEQMINKY